LIKILAYENLLFGLKWAHPCLAIHGNTHHTFVFCFLCQLLFCLSCVFSGPRQTTTYCS